MKKTLLFILVLTCSVNSFSQKLKTPSEILQLINDSKIAYVIGMLDTAIRPINRSANVLPNTYYRHTEKEGFSTLEYNVSKEVIELENKAEEYFGAGKPKEAREYYLMAFNKDTTYYKLLTYIGQTYEMEHDYKTAIIWLNKAIANNSIDYLAHWFIADCYETLGEYDKAVDEITISLILNRNNNRIFSSLERIYAKNNLAYSNWVFNPQMKISSEKENQVTIMADSIWLVYALTKAVWMYEPGYKESAKVQNIDISSFHEKECILGLLSMMETTKVEGYPEIYALKSALDKKLIEEYIFFEIILPKYPFIAVNLPEDFLKTMKDYVLAVHGRKKK